MTSWPGTWTVEPHVCLACLGRVLSQKPKDGPTVFRCSNCNLQGESFPRSMCCCGAKIGEKNAGIRCVPNDRPTPEFPSEIVAKEVS